MPEVEGLGPLVAKGLEAGAKSLGKDLDNSPMLKAVEHIMSPESQMTGVSGQYLLDTIHKHLYPEIEVQKSILTKQAQQTGSAKAPQEINTEARQNAANTVYGTKRENLAAIIKAVHNEHGPAKAIQLTDAMGIILHEGVKGPSAMRTSHTAGLIAKSPQFKGIDINFNPSPYEGGGPVSNMLTKATVAALAPHTAVWHSAQAALNASINSHASSMVKALTDIYSPKTFKDTQAMLHANNVLGTELLDNYAQKWSFDHGLMGKYTQNSVGEFLHKNFLTPGLSYVQHFNNVYSAMTGKYEAEWAAHQVLSGGTLRSFGEKKLNEFGLSAQNVLANGGLTQEMRTHAMRRMVQLNMHTEAIGARSTIISTSPLAKGLNVFHRYATMEGRLITKRLAEVVAGKHDPMMALQIMASIGIAFPTAGFFINNVLKAATGREKHPLDNFASQEKSYLEGKDFADALLMIGHMGAGGVMYDYANATTRQKLQSALIGATANMAVEGIQDAAAGAAGTGPHKWDKFKRDVLRDMPSLGLGATLAHHLYPTQTEVRANTVKTSRQLSAERAARLRKMRKGAH